MSKYLTREEAKEACLKGERVSNRSWDKDDWVEYWINNIYYRFNSWEYDSDGYLYYYNIDEFDFKQYPPDSQWLIVKDKE